jgi:hypothetical protein
LPSLHSPHFHSHSLSQSNANELANQSNSGVTGELLFVFVYGIGTRCTLDSRVSLLAGGSESLTLGGPFLAHEGPLALDGFLLLS